MGSKHGWRYRLARRYRCPCCDNFTLEEKPPGTFDICPVCFWEDDYTQYDEPDLDGGANEMSLNQARANYRSFGAQNERSLGYIRKPLDIEKASDTFGLSLEEIRAMPDHKGLLPRIWFSPIIPILIGITIGIIALIWGLAEMEGDISESWGEYLLSLVGLIIAAALFFWGSGGIIRQELHWGDSSEGSTGAQGEFRGGTAVGCGFIIVILSLLSLVVTIYLLSNLEWHPFSGIAFLRLFILAIFVVVIIAIGIHIYRRKIKQEE